MDSEVDSEVKARKSGKKRKKAGKKRAKIQISLMATGFKFGIWPFGVFPAKIRRWRAI